MDILCGGQPVRLQPRLAGAGLLLGVILEVLRAPDVNWAQEDGRNALHSLNRMGCPMGRRRIRENGRIPGRPHRSPRPHGSGSYGLPSDHRACGHDCSAARRMLRDGRAPPRCALVIG